MKHLIAILFVIALFTACEEEVVVKPSAQLRLEYEKGPYNRISTDCPYSFEINGQATLQKKGGCNMNVTYPSMKATLYLTYRPIQGNNLDSLLYDAQKLTYDHTIKANRILEQPRVDSINDVYGMLYMINGDAATQSQFYVTDSTKHFLVGSVYFEAAPNFDSIYPAVSYLREDVRTIMETLRWKEETP